MSETTYGRITCRLFMEFAGKNVSLGTVSVPVTGRMKGQTLDLCANLDEVKRLVQEIFNQSAPTNQEDES